MSGDSMDLTEPMDARVYAPLTIQNSDSFPSVHSLHSNFSRLTRSSNGDSVLQYYRFPFSSLSRLNPGHIGLGFGSSLQVPLTETARTPVYHAPQRVVPGFTGRSTPPHFRLNQRPFVPVITHRSPTQSPTTHGHHRNSPTPTHLSAITPGAAAQQAVASPQVTHPPPSVSRMLYNDP